jgi:hypothetical protein
MSPDADDVRANVARLAATLGVPADCEPDQLRAAYKDLARIHHPDRGGDPDFMVFINDAYRELLALLTGEMPGYHDDAAGDGWEWADDVQPDGVARLTSISRSAFAFVLLPAAALVLVVAAMRFITAIG